jgi:hypothetical protein
MERLFRQALLRYLAVAHFGRGQGEFRELEAPAHWSGLVEEELRPRLKQLRKIWELGARGTEIEEADRDALMRAVERTLRAVLLRAYPHARELLA